MVFRDRKYDKARRWFSRAIVLNPDLGDCWAYYYQFELHHGSDHERQDIITRISRADPAHGELWCKISKKTENRRLTADKKLVKVVAYLEQVDLQRVTVDAPVNDSVEDAAKMEDA